MPQRVHQLEEGSGRGQIFDDDSCALTLCVWHAGAKIKMKYVLFHQAWGFMALSGIVPCWVPGHSILGMFRLVFLFPTAEGRLPSNTICVIFIFLTAGQSRAYILDDPDKRTVLYVSCVLAVQGFPVRVEHEEEPALGLFFFFFRWIKQSSST